MLLKCLLYWGHYRLVCPIGDGIDLKGNTLTDEGCFIRLSSRIVPIETYFDDIRKIR